MKSTRPVKAQYLASILPQSRFVFRIRDPGKNLYLTFDDGPNPDVTPRVLDVLAEFGAAATFFCVGSNLQKFPEPAMRAHREGHTLGNHSFRHKGFARLSRAEQLAEIEQTNNLLREITGAKTHPFRAPQGRWNMGLMLRLMSRGVRCVHWSLDSADYQREPTMEFIQRMKASVPVPGDVMLFHDDGALCVDALTELLPWWRDRGFSFAALPE